VPYNVKTNEIYSVGFNGTRIATSSGTMNDLVAKLAQDADVIASRTFITAFSTDYFGIPWEIHPADKTINFKSTGGAGFSYFTPWTPQNSTVQMLPIANMTDIVPDYYDLQTSAFQLARGAQLQVARNYFGNDFSIDNVKTSFSPYTALELVDGEGNYNSYDAELVNYLQPNETAKIFRIGSLGMSNKVAMGFDNYKNINTTSYSSDIIYYYKNASNIQNAFMNTTDRSTPILSDTAIATNTLNQNSNKMVYENAKLALTNQAISQKADRTNLKISQSASNQELKNTQKQQNLQRSVDTGAYTANAVAGLVGQSISTDNWVTTKNTVQGGASGLVKGAEIGARGGVPGAIVGAVAGGAVGGTVGYYNAQGQNAVYHGAQDLASTNQAISQNAASKQQNVSQKAASKIANNNYENTIANFQASQRDLNLQPATVSQQGGDSSFTNANYLHNVFLQIKTENAMRIFQQDRYYSMFGYANGEQYQRTALSTLTHSRVKFNYIKTTDIKFGLVGGKSNYVDFVDDDMLDNLALIFNNGVTIWHVSDENELFDYSGNLQVDINKADIENYNGKLIDFSKKIDLLNEPVKLLNGKTKRVLRNVTMEELAKEPR